MKENILVTGGAGFIGSHIAQKCIEMGYNVVVLDDLSGGFTENVPEYSNFIHGSIQDEELLDTIFKYHNFKYCFHLSAYASEGRSNHIRKFIHYNNTVGTAKVINACVNYGVKLIFTSSVAVYSGFPPFDEDQTPNPIDEYGLSKWMSEKSIQIAGDTQGLDWVIIRPRNVYGERQNLFDPSRNLFGIFCYKALNNLPLTIYGDGSSVRSFTYIGDIIDPIWQSKDISKEIINLGSTELCTVKLAAEIFGIVSGYTKIIHTEPRHEVAEAYCNADKSAKLLGYIDGTDFHTGLSKMWEWAKTVKMRELQVPPVLEVNVNKHSSL